MLAARWEKATSLQDGTAKTPPQIVAGFDADDDFSGDSDAITAAPPPAEQLMARASFAEEHRAASRPRRVRLPDQRSAILVGTVVLLI